MGTQKLPICIIEDNHGIRKLFSTLLNKGGFQTVDFAEGKAAFKMAGKKFSTCSYR